MDRSKFNLTSKYCLITGSGGLLGKEHAAALLEIKSNIILTDINIKKINSLKKKLSKSYPKSKIFTYKMDVSKEKSILKVAKNLKKKKIKLHALINNLKLPLLKIGENILMLVLQEPCYAQNILEK